MDEPSAGNDEVIDSESSSRSGPEKEKDDASVCEGKKPGHGIRTLVTVSCHRLVHTGATIFRFCSPARVTPALQVHCRGSVPLDAMQSQRLKKQRRLRPRELVLVQVEEVDSPGRFYISYSSGEEAQAMDTMMLELRLLSCLMQV